MNRTSGCVKTRLLFILHTAASTHPGPPVRDREIWDLDWSRTEGPGCMKMDRMNYYRRTTGPPTRVEVHLSGPPSPFCPKIPARHLSSFCSSRSQAAKGLSIASGLRQFPYSGRWNTGRGLRTKVLCSVLRAAPFATGAQQVESERERERDGCFFLNTPRSANTGDAS